MKLYDKFPIWVTNSLSGQKELVKSIYPGRLGMYVCGPTVYSDVHLGNVRTFISFDIMARYFRHLGYTVCYVRNITDVGHLESEDHDGEDKILKKALLKKIEPMEVVKLYTEGFHETMRLFNVQPPSIEPSATGHIVEQIALVQKLLHAGFAYEVNGSVYFDVIRYSKQHHYGILSGRVVDELMAGGRELTAQHEKKNSVDFALWKKASSRHIMHWASPWGQGFPGWHLECTVMSTKYLGDNFDIHGGGMDLKFPHHECEIAQSVGSSNNQPAKYWIHTNMLTLNGKKMSKSLGNSILPNELLAGSHPLITRRYGAMTVRFFMLQSHYSSTLDMSNEALEAAERGYKKLVNAMTLVEHLTLDESGCHDEVLCQEINELTETLYCTMSDDFNTAKTLAVLFKMAARINDFKTGNIPIVALDKKTFQSFKKSYIEMFRDVLGLHVEQHTMSRLTDYAIRMLIDIRKQARTDRNYRLSDKIRDDLDKAGVQLNDSKDGSIDYVIKQPI